MEHNDIRNLQAELAHIEGESRYIQKQLARGLIDFKEATKLLSSVRLKLKEVNSRYL